MDAERKKSGNGDFDHWLDEALRARVEVEPRMGLEDRVLARIAGERRTGFRWWPAAAIAATVSVIALAAALLRPNPPDLTIANAEIQLPHSAAVETRSAQAKPAANRNTMPVGSHSGSTSKNKACCARANGVVSGRPETEHLPKLATFPALRPATAEERMLAQLATQLTAQQQFSEIANLSIDAAPKDLSIRELNVEPLETAPADSSPQQ